MASANNAPRILQSAFANRMADNAPKGYAGRIGKVVLCPGVASYRVGSAAVGGEGSTLTGTATSASNSDWFSFESSFSTVKKYVKSVVPAHTMASDYALADAGGQLADTAQGILDSGFVAGLEGLFAVAHPRVGTGAGQVGAGKYYLDTGLKGLSGESGEFTQDNLITSALAEASLNTAIKLMLQYRHDRGFSLGCGANGGMVLTVGAKNAQVAHELVRSQLSGNDMASNFVNGLITDIVVLPKMTDDDDWYLIDKAKSPIGLAISTEPTCRISYTTDGLFCELVAEVEYTFWKAPYEGGIIGANIA